MPLGRGVASDVRAASVAVLMAFYDAFNRGNIDAAVEFLHPQFEWRPAFGRALMGHNIYLGRDGFRTYYRDLQDSSSNTAWTFGTSRRSRTSSCSCTSRRAAPAA